MVLSRRSFIERLSLTSGAALVPALVSGLVREARGQTSTRKRAVFVVQGNGWNADHCFVKGTVGGLATQQTSGFSLPAALAPLAAHRNRSLFLDGLSNWLSWLEKPDAHSAGFRTLTGLKSGNSPGGESIDQYLARTVGKDAPFKWVGLAGVKDANAGLTNHTLSATGAGKQVALQGSPLQAFNGLFGSSSAGTGMLMNNTDALKLASARKKSVLDFMMDDIQRAQNALAGAERAKLDEYLSGVRALEERRIKQLADLSSNTVSTAATCGSKPAFATTHYEDRLAAHFEIATMALACGLTQVVLISSGTGSEFFQFYKKFFSTGYASHEDWGHKDSASDGIAKYTKVNAYHAELIAGMATKLSAAKEGDKSVFDNTVISWLNDGGAVHHSNQLRWPVVVVGNAGGGLKADGRYVKYPFRPHEYVASPPPYRSMSEYYVTLAQALGAPNNNFGKGGAEEVRGALPELV